MHTRRQWICSVASALAGGALAGGSLLGAPGVAWAGERRVLIIGDSMVAGGFGIFLAQALGAREGVTVERRGRVSTGLARPDFYDWIEHGAEARAAFKPDAVVCMLGGNDGQGLYMGKDSDPLWHRYGEPGWDPEYRRRVNAFADVLAPAGEQIYWVGMPQMGLSKLNERVRHMNKIFRGEMAVRRRALFIDIWRVLADEDGGYCERLDLGEGRVRVRTADGIHIARAGANRLVEWVAPQIT